MLRLVRAGSDEAEEALRSAPATVDDLTDAAHLGPIKGAARLIRRRLLRAYAASTLGVAPATVSLGRSAQGGLYVLGPTHLFASVAGRGDWTALALSDRPVGVDVEIRPPEHPLPLNLLHPRERRTLEALSGPIRDLAFLRFWTAREAYVKAQEKGLPAELAEIEAQNAAGGPDVNLIEQAIAVARAAITMQADAIAAVVELPVTD